MSLPENQWKCKECGGKIVYSDRWYKKCENGHLTPLSPKQQYEYEKAHGEEK